MQKAVDMPFAGPLSHGNRREFAYIVPRSEHVAISLYQHHADIAVVLGALDGVGKGAVHAVGEGIFLVWPGKRDGQDAIRQVNLNFRGHARLRWFKFVCEVYR